MLKGLSDLRILPWSKWQDPHGRDALSLLSGKQHPVSKDEDRGTPRGILKNGPCCLFLTIYCLLVPLTHTLCPVMVFHDFPLFIKYRIKMLRSGLTISLGLNFLVKVPMSHKTDIKFLCFCPVNLCWSVSFSYPTREFMMKRLSSLQTPHLFWIMYFEILSSFNLLHDII